MKQAKFISVHLEMLGSGGQHWVRNPREPQVLLRIGSSASGSKQASVLQNEQGPALWMKAAAPYHHIQRHGIKNLIGYFRTKPLSAWTASSPDTTSSPPSQLNPPRLQNYLTLCSASLQNQSGQSLLLHPWWRSLCLPVSQSQNWSSSEREMHLSPWNAHAHFFVILIEVKYT